MVSEDLVNLGFVRWISFSLAGEKELLNVLPSKHGTYAIRSARMFGRFFGESDIIYIGSSQNSGGLRNRLYQYFHVGSSNATNKRIHALMGQDDRLTVAWKICDSGEKARCIETVLLQQYEADHWELPPLNHRGTR